MSTALRQARPSVTYQTHKTHMHVTHTHTQANKVHHHLDFDFVTLLLESRFINVDASAFHYKVLCWPELFNITITITILDPINDHIHIQDHQ